jgi:hypothetical protein
MPLLEILYEKERRGEISLDPFLYSADFTAGINGPLTSMVPIGIQADSHFIARYFTITALTGSAGSQVVATATPPLLVQMFNTSSGRTLFDNPQPVQNVMGGVAAGAGTGSLPFILPEPWLLRAAGTCQVTLQNLGNTNFTRIVVSLIGLKAFNFGTNQPANLQP